MKENKFLHHSNKAVHEALIRISELASEADSEHRSFVINALDIIQAYSYDYFLIQSTVREVEQRLMPIIIRKKLQRRDPSARVSRGDIEIGQIHKSNSPFMLGIDKLPEGFLVGGRPKSGKSNSLKQIMVEIKNKKGKQICFLVLDFKNEYKEIITSEQLGDFAVIDAEELNLKPFRSPHNKDYQWIQVVINLLRREGDFTILPVHRRRLLKHVKEIIDQKGHCDFFDLIDRLEGIVGNKFLSSKERGMLEIPLEILISVAEQLCLSRGAYIPLETLLRQNTIIRMHLLSQELQDFLADFILYWLYCYKDFTGDLSYLVVICDEAKRLFSREKEERAGSVPYLRIIFSQGRFLNIAFLLADQYLSLLASYVDDVNTCICFSQTGVEEVNQAAKRLGLNEKERNELQNLPVGQAFAKIGDYPYPFRICVRKAPGFTQISESKLKELMKPKIAQLKVSDRPEFKKEHTGIVSEPVKEAPKEVSGVFSDWKYFLQGVYDNPDLNVSQLYEHLGLSARKGTKLKQELLAHGMIKEEVIHTNERKRPQKRMMLTESGSEYIKQKKDSGDG